MSPAAQFAAVATLTVAILGFQTIALAALGITAVLTLYGFRVGLPPAPAPESDPASPEAPTPEEALRRDG